jgi:WhiB family redox-sensing transcriptional regulator
LTPPLPAEPDPVRLPPRLMNDHAWQDNAACPAVIRATGDLDLFFAPPEDIERVDLAKRTCNRCPVKIECLDVALDRGDEYGIFGGLTPYERVEARRKRQNRANKDHVEAAMRHQRVHLTVAERRELTRRAVIEGMPVEELADLCGWTRRYALKQMSAARTAHAEAVRTASMNRTLGEVA